MDLKTIAEEIKEIISQRQKELRLSFVEKKHIYYMMDTDGKIRSNFPSVSKLVKKFHEPFDANAKSLQMCKGDVEAQKLLLAEWRAAGDYSTNMGSRVHYLLETDLVERYGNYKEIRQPEFVVDDIQIGKSDKMIEAGKQYIDLMHERGAVLLDTEMVLGDPELGYTGQPDKNWLMFNKEKTDIGFVVSDWKSNQPKNFIPQWYNKYLYPPFNKHRDYALTHYFVQLPLYARLLLKMLKGSKYEDLKLLGCVVTLLKEDGTFEEFRVPPDINQTILTMDITKYTKK
jgi:hypothetical protein